MATVTNQNIPTDHVEDALDPPIEEITQYRKTLTEGLPIAEAPAGTDRVYFTRKGARMAERDASTPGPSPLQEWWRDLFADCVNWWKGLPNSTDTPDICSNNADKNYREGEPWYPHSGGTAYHNWMEMCLDHEHEHPKTTPPIIDALIVRPQTFNFCPNQDFLFDVTNAVPPLSSSANCGELNDVDIWTAPEFVADCGEKVTIVFTDKDGRKGCAIGYPIEGDECCCIGTEEIAIDYDSLLVNCGFSQIFNIAPEMPGCPPYEWSLEGDGELEISEDGELVTYTAPDSNPDCANKPTIRVEDKCGNQAEITLAISCGGEQQALAVTHFELCECRHYANGGICGYDYFGYAAWTTILYDCNGNLLEQCGPTRTCEDLSWAECGAYTLTNGQGCFGAPQDCWTAQCECACGNTNCPCDELMDCRTATMKQAGCCPINPETGLPY